MFLGLAQSSDLTAMSVSDRAYTDSQDGAPTQAVIIGCGFIDYGAAQPAEATHLQFNGSVVPTVLGCVQ